MTNPVRRQIDGIADRSRRLLARIRMTRRWAREERYIRARRMFDVAQTDRTWTRDQLYEERVSRAT